MGNSRKKKILMLAGTTYLLITGTLLLLMGLILVIILFGNQAGEPESSAGRVARKRPPLITFPDLTAIPVAEVGEGPDQTAPEPATLNLDTAAAISTRAPNRLSSDPAGPVTPHSSPQTNRSPAPQTGSNTTNLSVPTATPTPTPGVTLVPGQTPSLTPTFTMTPTPSPLPSNTPVAKSPTPAPGSITGRILLDGVPVDGVTIKLEDQGQNTVAQTVVAGDGSYSFPNLAASGGGYNLVFAQEWNSHHPLDQVVSWGWLGPIPVADGDIVEIPDFEISLLGFEPTSPAPNASVSAASVSPSGPIQFEWSAYPGAARYWVDLAHGQDQTVLWQAAVQGTSLSFDGTLSDGSHIQPGEYWWGVGARRDLGAYKLTIYGYLPVLLIVP